MRNHSNRCFRRYTGLCLAGFVAVAALLHGCVTPPAIPPAGWDDLDLIDYPPGSERVELTVDDERTLVGVFVPAGEGAPLVVILPGAMETVTQGSSFAVRLSAGPQPGESADNGKVITETTIGRFSYTTSGSTDQPLHARAEVGWPGAPMGNVVGFSALSVNLEEELWGRELTLSWALLEELRAQGLATLFVDYGGVGASTGELDADCLADDAWAIWSEALARVGADPGRIILRGTSLGTVAVASLLERGARPAAATLVAPVRGETVVEHFVDWTDGPWWQHLALPFVDSLTDVDLVAALGDYAGRLLIYVPAEDALLPADERALVLASCEREGADWSEVEAGHESLAIAGHGPLPGELDSYTELFPEASRTPLLEALLLSLGEVGASPLARAGSPERARWEAYAPWLARLPPGCLADLDLPAAAALLDLDDPDGALDPACPAALATLLSSSDSPRTMESLAALVARFAAAAQVAFSGRFSMIAIESDALGKLDEEPFFAVHYRRHGVRIEDPEALALYLLQQQLSAETTGEDGLGLSPEAGRRRALRRLLKGLGIPDRFAGDGTLEAFVEGCWQALP